MVQARDLTRLKRPSALRKRLFRLERSGRYREALDELSDIWPDLDACPDLSGFPEDERAEIKLRCGALIGFYAHTSQRHSQSVSMDLVGSARGDFELSGSVDKLAECDNYLALAYWRTGELHEAQAFIESSFSFDLPDSSAVRLHAYIIQCLIGVPAEGKDARNLESLKSVEAAFLRSDDECLKGDFFNHCGMALDNLGRKSEALDHYEFAKFHHERSRHRSYLATVENNLAYAYQNTGDFRRAHAAIDNAVRLLKAEKDKTREGFALDTKAGLFMAEKRYFEAFTTIEKAVAILKRSENKAYYVETLLTRSKILLGLDSFHEAFMTLVETVSIARVQTGEESAKRLTDEFKNAYDQLNKVEADHENSSEGSSVLELLLPASLGNYTDYRGVWIHNSRLESVGIRKGALAVIGEGEISRGDLVAVAENESGEVVCGFYDSDFGMIGLEGSDGEILMYDETAVRLLGKIIGVCNGGPAGDGKMSVEAIKF